MKIDCSSISIMVTVIDQLRLFGIPFECSVDDYARSTIWLEELEDDEIFSKVTI